MENLRLRVECTRKHLLSALQCGQGNLIAMATNCWVAIAVRELIPDAHVTGVEIMFGGFHDRPIDLPVAVTHAIMEFDRRSPAERLEMQPFSFEVEIDGGQLNGILRSNGWDIDRLISTVDNSQTLELI